MKKMLLVKISVMRMDTGVPTRKLSYYSLKSWSIGLESGLHVYVSKEYLKKKLDIKVMKWSDHNLQCVNNLKMNENFLGEESRSIQSVVEEFIPIMKNDTIGKKLTLGFSNCMQLFLIHIGFLTDFILFDNVKWK